MVTMIQTDKLQKLIFILCVFFCIISFFLLLFLVNTYNQSLNHVLEVASNNAERQAKNASQNIGEELDSLKAVTESNAQELSTGRINGSQISERLKETIDKHPELLGVVVAFKPYEYNPEKRLYAPYYVMTDGERQLIQIENVYDYTQPDNTGGNRTIWYNQPIRLGAGWIEPYYGTASKSLIAVYSSPFYRTNASMGTKSPIGVTSVIYSLEDVRHLVGSFDLGNTGYGFIITEKGTIVSHPIKEYLGKNIANSEIDETFRMMSQNVTFGKYKVINNKITNQNFWVYYEPIPSTNWTLGVSFVQDEILDSMIQYKHHALIQIGIVAIVFLFFLIVLIFRAYKFDVHKSWMVAILFSILCIIGTGLIIYISIDEISNDNHMVFIVDKTSTEACLNKLTQKINYSSSEYHEYIPTGIFLNSLQFLKSHDIYITGYIWQKAPSNTNITAGITFPEATNIEMEEVSNSKNVTMWNFKATIRKSFDYSKYPFDSENVGIRLWNKDLDQKVILTPDLDSYNVIQPDLKPGLDKDLFLEGYEIQKSYFTYKLNSYTTNLGIREGESNQTSELYFNVDVKRNFKNVLLSDLPPLIIAFILLFIVILRQSIDTEANTKHDIRAGLVLTYCAALLFVLITFHLDLQRQLDTDGIFYMGYYYYIVYLTIIWVSISSILLGSMSNHWIIYYRDNFIAKLFYWPVISLCILVITLFVFY